MAQAAEERIVTFRPRTVLVVFGLVILVVALLALVYLAWHIITWILIAAFLAVALNPAVEILTRRGVGRGLASALVFVTALVLMVGIGLLIVPPLIDQIRDFVNAVPGFVEDLTKGRGRLGFLERDYHLVERVREAVEKKGLGSLLGVTQPAVAVAKGVVTAVVGVVTVAFLTFFMLLEGPRTVERFLDALPAETSKRWRRVGGEIYRTIGGYVTGNLVISFIAGVASAIMLFAVGSSYAVALGLVVAIFDLVPLAGATIAAVLVTLVVVVELGWIQAVIVAVFFIVYQQLENHVLQPLVYGRTVQLSPLTVLIAILIGAELAGVLGALVAIPVTGSLLAIGREVLDYLRTKGAPEAI
jgi:predicted PurR-regulated permease PerM